MPRSCHARAHAICHLPPCIESMQTLHSNGCSCLEFKVLDLCQARQLAHCRRSIFGKQSSFSSHIINTTCELSIYTTGTKGKKHAGKLYCVSASFPDTSLAPPSRSCLSVCLSASLSCLVNRPFAALSNFFSLPPVPWLTYQWAHKLDRALTLSLACSARTALFHADLSVSRLPLETP